MNRFTIKILILAVALLAGLQSSAQSRTALFNSLNEELDALRLHKWHGTVKNPSSPIQPVSEPRDSPLVLMTVDPQQHHPSRIKTEISRLTQEGYSVVEVHHDALTVNRLAQVSKDVLSIRRFLKTHGPELRIDADETHVLSIGQTLVRGAVFFTARGYDYNMDIRYSEQSDSSRGIVLQITHKTDCRHCFNTYSRYDDSLLDTLAIYGYNTAYADHYGNGFLDYDKVDWMPQSIHPAKAAVQYLRSKAADYQFDAENIVAIGFSKGGTSSALLALTADEPNLELKGLYLGIPSRVVAAVSIGAHLDLDKLKIDSQGSIDDRWDNPLSQWGDPQSNPGPWQAGSAVSYASEGDSPLLLIAGERDSHRPKQAHRLKQKLDAHGIENSMIIVPGLTHRLPNDQATIAAVFSFIDRKITRPSF